ncbi:MULTISPECIES: response regulator [unclassified Anaerobiospirillum]|uniref:response regulator n=1 Tax=unclassified Anaerobiospirillum TaxID=2647410 RepID=UPI001FF4F294|nr:MULTISPECIES: response regulator [unclassified Anaerobiospirillum]MCK0525422.1 response regulator [Anaerobiospirillum sp. NML120449]MCK0535220.1 response regulator [Anaerobiospirillum sp. NML120511]MCK0540662.1 response regulator [Anaerobiospirillum sp. NML02-A-032]
MSATILVIEDEEHILKTLYTVLTDEGYTVYTASTLKQGNIEAATRTPDLVVLDLGLPDGDGLFLIKELRNYSMVPIIVLSARSDEQQKVQALDSGADDYVTKPFGISELLGRIRVQMRRQTILKEHTDNSIINLGTNVTVDTVKMIVTKNDQMVHLTKIEMRLLTAMIAESNKVLTQRYLMQRVWGAEYVEHPHYLRIYMGRLRAKLEDDPSTPAILITETGVGYRLVIN